MLNIAIFASGGGSNAEAIIGHLKSHSKLSVNLIVSNRKDAGVLKRANRHGIDTFVFNREEFRENKNITAKLTSSKIDLIVLAGFLWLIPKYLIEAFPNKIINIHPALLPKYGGKGMYGHHVHQAVFDNKEKESGMTIHYVNQHYDEGNIILQARCQLFPNDQPEDIARKVLSLEHQFYPVAVEMVGRWILEEG